MLQFDPGPVGPFLRDKLNKYEFSPQVYEYGTVESCSDDIVQVAGLPHSRYGELLEFENDAYGLALDLRLDGVGTVLLSKGNEVSAGSLVKGTGRTADICVGPELLGRVIDPIGRPLDGRELHAAEYRPVENPAPSIMHRMPVSRPLETGILAVDSMIPIGRGQRELIIGDRQTGKTSIALSAMLNQRGKDVICIYCSIGQKASTVAGLVHTLSETGAMEQTVVVSSTAGDSSAMQYLAPYAGCSIAEKFMLEGKDVLIVYDDLSKHAVAYRAISLLLRRPSGREAYPGDVFYLHSRLLERAAKLDDALGGGSITALPIVETMAGDISAYIPTNVISITDGQIYLESELFHAGIRPAVNVGLSVSRVGRAAQHSAMKQVSGSLRLDVAQYRDMAVFAQFGADIDSTTAKLLQRGERLTELLKQPQDQILSLAEQVSILTAYAKDCFSGLTVKEVAPYRAELLLYLKRNYSDIFETINTTGDFGEGGKEVLEKAIAQFAADYGEKANAKHQ
ncbi:MAG: F0F1 ATP synthase subunit alpha [Oscillospiraceae bacterium]|nr:F0F1 ATP synthase subunit alpha [Oscillospiraceae bacterium]